MSAPKTGGTNKILFIVIGILAAAVVVFAVLFVTTRKDASDREEDDLQEETSELADAQETDEKDTENEKADPASEPADKTEGDQESAENPSEAPKAEEPQAPEKKTPQDALDDPDGVLLADSSTVELTDQDLDAFGSDGRALTYARNEIYARHGAIFVSEELNQYFGSKSWYTPTQEAAKTPLSELETQNAQHILDYQKAHALEYKPQ